MTSLSPEQILQSLWHGRHRITAFQAANVAGCTFDQVNSFADANNGDWMNGTRNRILRELWALGDAKPSVKRAATAAGCSERSANNFADRMGGQWAYEVDQLDVIKALTQQWGLKPRPTASEAARVAGVTSKTAGDFAKRMGGKWSHIAAVTKMDNTAAKIIVPDTIRNDDDLRLAMLADAAKTRRRFSVAYR